MKGQGQDKGQGLWAGMRDNERLSSLVSVSFVYVLAIFRHKVLPVVMGAQRRDYEAKAPVHSFVHVDDFAGPQQLAEYLHLLDANDALYNEYFRWRETTWSPVEPYYWCRLCALLHWRDDVDYVSWYEDYRTWWNDACLREDDLPWFQRNMHNK